MKTIKDLYFKMLAITVIAILLPMWAIGATYCFYKGCRAAGWMLGVGYIDMYFYHVQRDMKLQFSK